GTCPGRRPYRRVAAGAAEPAAPSRPDATRRRRSPGDEEEPRRGRPLRAHRWCGRIRSSRRWRSAKAGAPIAGPPPTGRARPAGFPGPTPAAEEACGREGAHSPAAEEWAAGTARGAPRKHLHLLTILPRESSLYPAGRAASPFGVYPLTSPP